MNRRQILLNSVRLVGGLAVAPGLASGLLGTSAALADDAPVDDLDRIMGEEGAPVTIIEYSSLTCPHCASFHTGTLPQVKSDWIDAGKARLVYRHFPLDGVALRAAAVANCLEGDRHFTFLDALFRNQQRWARSDDPIAALGSMAKLAGMDEATFNACVEDDAEMERILARAREGAAAFDVQSTPTFVVNGRKVSGALPFEDFEKVLSEASPS